MGEHSKGTGWCVNGKHIKRSRGTPNPGLWAEELFLVSYTSGLSLETRISL